jgi:hypothetical protein
LEKLYLLSAVAVLRGQIKKAVFLIGVSPFFLSAMILGAVGRMVR